MTEQIEVHFRFNVVDEALLRDVYARYCDAQCGWAEAGLTAPADIAEELIINMDLLRDVVGHPVSWDKLGLER